MALRCCGASIRTGRPRPNWILVLVATRNSDWPTDLCPQIISRAVLSFLPVYSQRTRSPPSDQSKRRQGNWEIQRITNLLPYFVLSCWAGLHLWSWRTTNKCWFHDPMIHDRLVETCRRHNIPIRQYLSSVLPGLGESPRQSRQRTDPCQLGPRPNLKRPLSPLRTGAGDNPAFDPALPRLIEIKSGGARRQAPRADGCTVVLACTDKKNSDQAPVKLV